MPPGREVPQQEVDALAFWSKKPATHTNAPRHWPTVELTQFEHEGVNLIGKLVTLVSTLVLARLLAPEAFGLVALEAQAKSLIFQSNAVPLDVRARAALRLTRFAGLGLNTAFFISTARSCWCWRICAASRNARSS